MQQSHNNPHYSGSMVGTAGNHAIAPKTPNVDIYGFAQKAILHSIFDKSISGGPAG